MLTLKTFRRCLTQAARKLFAADAGATSDNMLQLFAYDGKTPSAEQAMWIELCSGGLVRVETLRPDLNALWHVLRHPRLDPEYVARRYALQMPLPVPRAPAPDVPSPTLRQE